MKRGLKLRFWKRINLLDLFLIVLVLLAALVLYFTFVRPTSFSHLIKREGVMRYAEVEILLSDDLAWMREVLPVGEEARNVYEELEWEIFEIGEKKLGGRTSTYLKAKLLIAEESSGLLRYGKYTLVKGGKIFLISDSYFLEGRILNFRLLDEEIRL